MVPTKCSQRQKSAGHSNGAAIMRIIHSRRGWMAQACLAGSSSWSLTRACSADSASSATSVDSSSSLRPPPYPGRSSTCRWCSRRSSRCPYCGSRTAAGPRADPTSRYRRISRATTAFLPAQRAMSTKLCLLRRLAQDGVEECLDDVLCRPHAVGCRQPLRLRAPHTCPGTGKPFHP